MDPEVRLRQHSSTRREQLLPCIRLPRSTDDGIGRAGFCDAKRWTICSNALRLISTSYLHFTESITHIGESLQHEQTTIARRFLVVSVLGPRQLHCFWLVTCKCVISISLTRVLLFRCSITFMSSSIDMFVLEENKETRTELGEERAGISSKVQVILVSYTFF